jgi:hypothetical protein
LGEDKIFRIASRVPDTSTLHPVIEEHLQERRKNKIKERTIVDELNWILKEKDIEILRNLFLFTLNDIQQQQKSNKEPVELSEVYKRMELELGEGCCCYYNLPIDIQPIYQNYLQPQGLIEVVNCNKVKITDKGRRRCEQITRTDQALWQETVRRLRSSRFATFNNPLLQQDK